MLTSKRRLRILDFDLENRPLSYWIPDEPTSEITAIASCWIGEPDTMMVHLLGQDDPIVMLEKFVARYNEADMVTGHYIRKHDLPTINGALMEFGMPQLEPKLTCDTRLDLKKKKGIPATQEHLSDMLGLDQEKVGMSQANWREANRLTPDGLFLTRHRCVGDVFQHMELREEMLKRGLLNPPKVWSP